MSQAIRSSLGADVASRTGLLNLARIRSNNSALPLDVRDHFDRAVIEVGTDRLALLDELMGRSELVTRVDPFEESRIRFGKVDSGGRATVTMDLADLGDKSGIIFEEGELPFYGLAKQFELSSRTEGITSSSGASMQDTHITTSTRVVNETLEDITLNGIPDTIGGASVFGALNSPGGNTFTFEGGTAWNNTIKLPENIQKDFQGMVKKLVAAGRFGPYVMVLGTLDNEALNGDYTPSQGEETVRERLVRNRHGSGEGQPLKIIVSDQMPADTVLVFQPTVDVVRVYEGFSPTFVGWVPEPGHVIKGAIIAFLVTLWTDDARGLSGVVVGFTS